MLLIELLPTHMSNKISLNDLDLEDLSLSEVSNEEALLLERTIKLAEDIGDWSEHLSFPEAMSITQKGLDEISSETILHLDKCMYCKNLVDGIVPEKKFLDSVLSGHSTNLENAPERPSFIQRITPVNTKYNYAFSSLLLIGLIFSTYGLIGQKNRVETLALSTLNKEDPKLSFIASNTFLELDEADAAYQMLSDGLTQASVEPQIVQNLSLATTSRTEDFIIQNISDPNRDLLVKTNQKVNMGEHARALVYIEEYLEVNNVDQATLNKYSVSYSVQ